MKDRFRKRGYYFITDGNLSRRGNREDMRIAVEAGVGVIQYREKAFASGALYEEAARLKAACEGRLFLVNDRIDIALAVGADGVHIGGSDLPLPLARRLLGPGAVIGVSVGSLGEAIGAESAGADYLGVGPVFPTATKADAGPATGTELIRRIKRSVGLPVVAIGGITPENAADVIAAGADMVCAISAVLAAKDPKRVMLQFEGLFL
ncbi:MAG: thiamine phosphate synthase [Spirochaetales bacterium]|nr:thiamine phosphate synthase [Spirochaetales bacterium]